MPIPRRRGVQAVSGAESNDRPPYVRFFPGDWKAGTAGWPLSLEWTYLQVCMFNWDHGKALPRNQLAIALSRNPSWEADVELLLDMGKVHRTNAGGLFNQRALGEFNRADRVLQSKRKGGRVSAKKPRDSSGLYKSAGNNQNQNQNQTPPNGGDPPAPQGGSSGDLFFTVPEEAMRAFRQHRTKLKHPMTDRAEELIVGKLEKIFNDHGHAPAAVIDQSILHGWRGVFPLKGDDDDRRTNGQAGPDRRDSFTRAVHDAAGDS